ncbi:MAG: hypothetical protein ACD_21C00220G0001 [uncultured bacterium]|nr:MAG: hypothetical protein ACD_21C00220G0001 [uncultured bacterium]
MVRLDQLKRLFTELLPILLEAKANVPAKDKEGKRFALVAPIISDCATASKRA